MVESPKVLHISVNHFQRYLRIERYLWKECSTGQLFELFNVNIFMVNILRKYESCLRVERLESKEIDAAFDL